MELNVFIEKVFAYAKNYDFDDFELYYQNANSLSLETYQAEISDYTDSVEMGIGFRAIVKGKAGSCFTEILDEESAKFIVDNAYQTATLIENDDKIILYAGEDEYRELNLYNPDLEQIENREKIDFICKLDAESAKEELVDKVIVAGYKDFFVKYRLVNSKGLDITYKRNMLSGGIVLVGDDGENKHTAYAMRRVNDFNELKNYDLKREALQKLSDKMGAKPIASGKYKVVLEREVAADLLAVNFSNFSAEAAQKGMSLLKDKIGEQIASDVVSIIDDPHLAGGFASAPFDGEGVPTFKKEIIKNGKFITFLHNLNTAQKDGVETTANASRPSYKSGVSVAPSNAYIANGEFSFEELLMEVGDGVLITDLTGLHAGANAVTGDFSLSAKGFKITDGKRAEAISDIVLSGNFFSLLKSIKAVANDLDFKKASIVSPSIFVECLDIAGE